VKSHITEKTTFYYAKLFPFSMVTMKSQMKFLKIF